MAGMPDGYGMGQMMGQMMNGNMQNNAQQNQAAPSSNVLCRSSVRTVEHRQMVQDSAQTAGTKLA